MQIYLNYLSENTNFRKLADVKEELLSGTSQQALSVSLESLLTSDIHICKLADVKINKHTLLSVTSQQTEALSVSLKSLGHPK